jgi:hypothetical protein
MRATRSRRERPCPLRAPQACHSAPQQMAGHDQIRRPGRSVTKDETGGFPTFRHVHWARSFQAATMTRTGGARSALGQRPSRRASPLGRSRVRTGWAGDPRPWMSASANAGAALEKSSGGAYHLARMARAYATVLGTSRIGDSGRRGRDGSIRASVQLMCSADQTVAWAREARIVSTVAVTVSSEVSSQKPRRGVSNRTTWSKASTMARSG